MKRLSSGRMVAIAVGVTLSFAGAPSSADVVADGSTAPTEVAQPTFAYQPLNAASPICGEACLPSAQSDAHQPPSSIHNADISTPSGPVAQAQLPFTDVPPDHWAYDALLYLSTGNRSTPNR